jgi:hypothetical protein
MSRIKAGDKFTSKSFPNDVFTCHLPSEEGDFYSSTYIMDTSGAYHTAKNCTLVSKFTHPPVQIGDMFVDSENKGNVYECTGLDLDRGFIWSTSNHKMHKTKCCTKVLVAIIPVKPAKKTIKRSLSFLRDWHRSQLGWVVSSAGANRVLAGTTEHGGHYGETEAAAIIALRVAARRMQNIGKDERDFPEYYDDSLPF